MSLVELFAVQRDAAGVAGRRRGIGAGPVDGSRENGTDQAVDGSMELSDAAHAEITRLCAAGDDLADEGRFEEAIAEYSRAWAYLPEPKQQWEAATFILAAIGDANFLRGAFAHGRESLAAAMHCPGAIGNPFLHLRLGQCQLELGQHERAADELARAYMGAGYDIFSNDDPKYFAFLKTRLQPPPGGWEA